MLVRVCKYTVLYFIFYRVMYISVQYCKFDMWKNVSYDVRKQFYPNYLCFLIIK